VLAIDREKRPLCNALMYNDRRAHKEADEIRVLTRDFEKKVGYAFNSSFALPKILWIERNRPDIFEKTHMFVHQTDYIVGKLCGEYGVSDYSNALKTGYDLVDETWPEFISKLGIERESLPEVRPPGSVIAKISIEAARETGMSIETKVVAGATDGYTSALSSGAAEPGDWATIIGTTMVLKGVTSNLVTDNKGRIYSHKHPQGFWMPGGASNVGGRCIEVFNKEDFKSMDEAAKDLSPTGVFAYPLTGVGERFPFIDQNAEYSISKDNLDEKSLYTALLEGVAYTERLSYDVVENLGCEVRDEIFTAGGACKSDVWLQIRADVLGKSLKVPSHTDAAMGAALIGALSQGYSSVKEASNRMIKIVKTLEPRNEKKKKYDEFYVGFKEMLKNKGYIEN